MSPSILPSVFRRNSLGLLCLVLVVYLPVSFAGYIWDDAAYVAENEHLHTLAGLREIWCSPGATPQYYPLVFTSFWLEFQLWQLHPLGYHIDNVVLHGINAVLLYRILMVMRIPGAFLTAAIFAVHPVHVESVAWIAERKNVLSGLFYLLAFQAYWRFATADDSCDSRRRWGWWVWALVCFTAALLSKSVTASLAPALLVALWWRDGQLHWRRVLPLVPFFALALAAGLHTAHLEAHHVGADGGEWSWTYWERCVIAGRAVWFYAAKLVWPWPLVFIYPKWKIIASDWRQAIAPISAMLVLIGLWRGRSRLGRGPLAAALFFGGTLFPALGFINVYPMRFSFVADHFQYLASIGVIVILVAATSLSLQRRHIPWNHSFLAASLLLLALASVSFLRCFDYRDSDTLWSATLADNPDCWLAQYHLARVRFSQHRYREAAELYKKVLEQKRNGRPDPAEMSEVHVWLADSYEAAGNTAAAREYRLAALNWFRQAMGDKYHDEAAIHHNIAILHAKLGQIDEAIVAFRRMLELDPGNAGANYELGELLLGAEDFDQSAACFENVLRHFPQSYGAHYNLGIACFKLGDKDRARAHLETAVRIRPDLRPARLLLGRILSDAEKQTSQ